MRIDNCSSINFVSIIYLNISKIHIDLILHVIVVTFKQHDNKDKIQSNKYYRKVTNQNKIKLIFKSHIKFNSYRICC